MTVATIILLTLQIGIPGFARTKEHLKPWLGMGVIVQRAPDGSNFLFVARIGNASPAFAAGLRPGDVITRIGRRASDFLDELAFLQYVAGMKPGQRVPFEFVRAGEKRATVVVGSLTPEYEAAWRDSLRRAERARRERERKRSMHDESGEANKRRR
ncbi:MAG: PDZ domain-containing protein [Thermoanaerobaculia bacterium]